MFARFGPRYRYYVSFTAMLGTMAMALTATMTNVALPVLMGTFGVGQDKVHWVSTGFIAPMSTPRARRPRTREQATSVLPTPVSVPVTKNPRRALTPWPLAPPRPRRRPRRVPRAGGSPSA